MYVHVHCMNKLASFPGSRARAKPSGGSKVIHGIIARKEGEPGIEAMNKHASGFETLLTAAVLVCG